jgi:N-acetylneuraminic acid mutarotase
MLHAIGGRVMGDDVLATHEVYNPATNTWRKAAPMPTPRDHVASFVVGGKIHIIGGRTGATEANVANHDIYDPATDRWTAAPPMPTPRSSLAFAQLGDMLVVAGGECRNRMAYNEVEAFDVRNNRWVTLPDLPQPRHGFAAATAGDKLYFFGGSTQCGGGGKTAETLALTLR